MSMKFKSKFTHFHSRKSFDKIIVEMGAILSQPQCVNRYPAHFNSSPRVAFLLDKLSQHILI